MKLIALPAFANNCFWMHNDGHCAVVVDPAESAQVIRALDSHGLEPHMILVTPHRAELRPRKKQRR
jgi:hydroxyacylglutathione hydrolase